MRRSAYSIPMNLIEGSYRLNRKEYRQFVGIARGSAGEMIYQLLLSRDLGYISDEDHKFFREEYQLSKNVNKISYFPYKENKGEKKEKKILDKFLGEWYTKNH